MYDHPFLWGSKRTGPDLHREGLKYPDSWHYNHMLDPESMSAGTIMPAYSWLHTSELDTSNTAAKINAMRTIGVPYPEGYDKIANADLVYQEQQIVKNLEKDKIQALPNSEIIALIAYLQRLGTDIKADKAHAQK